MGNNKQRVIKGENILTQLESYKQNLLARMSPEEKKTMELTKKERPWQEDEFKRKRKKLKDFLYGFRFDSDVCYNNFFRKRRTESFDYWELHGYRQMLEFKRNVYDDKKDKIIVHCGIDKSVVDELINLAIMIELSPPLEEDTIFYRGCVNIDENGVNGIVSVTSDKSIAEQYSKGTLLTVVVPKGTRMLDAGAIWPEEWGNEFDKTYILPPCNYEVLSESEMEKGKEPNNPNLTTKQYAILVTPLDLLEEFLKVLKDPPENYDLVRRVEDEEYEEAVLELKKNPSDKDYQKRVDAGNYEQTVSYLENYLIRRNTAISKGIKVYSKTNFKAS